MENVHETRIRRILGLASIVLAVIGAGGFVVMVILPAPVSLITLPACITVMVVGAVMVDQPMRSARRDPHSWIHAEFHTARITILMQ